MGMNYSISFHNARIAPQKYPELIGWSDEDAQREPERAAELALEQVRDLLRDGGDDPVQDEAGINLDGCGFWDHASYSFGDDLLNLLQLCGPGAYIHDTDVEEFSGDHSLVVVRPDGSLRRIPGQIHFPGFDFPENLEDLLEALRSPLGRFDEDRSLITLELALQAARTLLGAFEHVKSPSPAAEEAAS